MTYNKMATALFVIVFFTGIFFLLKVVTTHSSARWKVDASLIKFRGGLDTEIDIDQQIRASEKRLVSNESPLNLNELAFLYLKKAKQSGRQVFLERAYKLAKQSIKTPSGGLTARLILIRILQIRHEFEKSILEINRLSEMGAMKEELDPLRFTAYLAIGDGQSALAVASEMVRNLEETSTLVMRGLAKEELGNSNGAFSDYLRAISLEKFSNFNSSAWARNCLGSFLAKTGELDEAEEVLKEAYKIDPLNLQTQDLLGEIYLQKKEYILSEKTFSRAFFQSSDALFLVKLAEINQRLGKFADASKFLNLAEENLTTDLQKGSSGHRLHLVKLLLLRRQENDIQRAIDLLKQELSVRRSAEIFEYLGLGYYLSNDLALSMEALKQAEKTGRKSAFLKLLQSRILNEMGQKADSMITLKEALFLNPLVLSVYEDSLKRPKKTSKPDEK